MLKIEKLGKIYNGKAALRDVTLDIVPGSFVGVIGRSGAGKSTLLRCINRLVDPSQGRIVFGDVDVTALKGKELARLARGLRHDFPAVQPRGTP